MTVDDVDLSKYKHVSLFLVGLTKILSKFATKLATTTSVRLELQSSVLLVVFVPSTVYQHITTTSSSRLLCLRWQLHIDLIISQNIQSYYLSNQTYIQYLLLHSSSISTSISLRNIIMINRQALIVVLAAATATTHAFVVPPSATSIHRPLYSSIENRIQDETEQITNMYQQASELSAANEEEKKLIMDIPPMPVAPTTEPANKPAAAKKEAPKKKGKNPHKEGVFSPIVVAAGTILGEESLNKIRGKVIAIHSDLIKSFVDTADSSFGQSVLKQLFNLVDTDNSGYLDKEEVTVALNMLGFKWLKDKHVDKIFERADANGDEEISLEEFMMEAPKTLRTNLVKLAKKNGGDMGLLV